jgi:hypothetical protein
MTAKIRLAVGAWYGYQNDRDWSENFSIDPLKFMSRGKVLPGPAAALSTLIEDPL